MNHTMTLRHPIHHYPSHSSPTKIIKTIDSKSTAEPIQISKTSQNIWEPRPHPTGHFDAKCTERRTSAHHERVWNMRPLNIPAASLRAITPVYATDYGMAKGRRAGEAQPAPHSCGGCGGAWRQVADSCDGCRWWFGVCYLLGDFANWLVEFGWVSLTGWMLSMLSSLYLVLKFESLSTYVVCVMFVKVFFDMPSKVWIFFMNYVIFI